MFDFFKKDNSKVVHVNDMEQLIGKVELIDIREPYEYKSGSLKTAKNIPMGTLLASAERYLTKDKTYYILCQSGARSGRTVKQLTNLGFDVINVAGGMGSYVGTNRK
ncbi:MAG: sulfurtransferase [Clostridia bacterium]|nr:sulfurtransferase [Clostridia bacterium]